MNTIRDIRERKSDGRIKGKNGGGQISKDVRRSMTVKLQKELAERTRSRDDGSSTDTLPEAQAVEQAEESAVNLVGGVNERTGDGFSKAVRHSKQARREKQSPHQRPAPATGDAPTPAEDAAQPTPSAQERVREKAVADIRERWVEQYRPFSPHIEPKAAPATPPAHIPESNGISLENQSINPINPVNERSRRAAKPKEKPAGGAFTPKTRQSAAKVVSRKTAPTAAKGKTVTRQATARAKLRVQRNAQRKLLRQANQRTAKRAADLSRRAATAIVKAVASIVSAIAGLAGGAILLPVIIVIILVAAIMASPFGILFANEPTPNAMPLNVAVGQLNMELSNQLELLQSGDYDSIDVQGQGPNWREVVAVFAAKTAGAADGVDVAALTPDRVDRLKTVFWDMCAVASEVETIDHPGTDGGGGWTEYILHITITPKTAEEMRTQYAFTSDQNKALTELLAELATMELLLTDLTASQEQARELLKNLPDNLTPERRAVVETACQLVGKVSYFWGAKSLVLGWDNRWGTIQRVWADGSSTTGTFRPYGLDCSGFVDWAIYNVSNGSYVIGHGGGATMQHNYCTPISWADALPGDLVFYPEDSHVGIVGGRDADGNLLIVHCASSYNGVVITGASGFTSLGRPMYYAE